MKFGIIEEIGPRFDAAVHIDLDKCRVTIDNFTANTGMWNYDKKSALLPLQHPLWRIDESAGQSIWRSKSFPHAEIQPVMPAAAFEVPLIPIDAWF